MHVKNTPVAFEMAENLADRLHVENSLWENISEAGVRVSVEGNTFFAIESGECGLQECSRTGGLCSKWKESCRKSKNVQSQGVYLRSGVSGFE